MMTKDKEDIIKQFFHQCQLVRLVCDEFKILYGCGEERLRLLNEVAKDFFHILNRILIELHFPKKQCSVRFFEKAIW